MSAVPEALAGPAFSWANPNYSRVLYERQVRLANIRAHPERLPAVREYYRIHLAEFISHWGVTFDPRHALLSPPKPVLMPFVLFPKQIECVDWILARARAREPGLVEKARDCGISWLAMSLAVALCLFNSNITIGVGSAKEDKIDRSGDPDCLLYKARAFLANLPPEFRGAWDESRDSAHLRLHFRDTQSALVGEAGDNIGRGGRSSIFFVDEAAFLEHPDLIESSLASNTDCRIDISSVKGMDNTFARKRHSGRVKVFTFGWRDDPRKDASWYARQRDTLGPVTLASQFDIDYLASAGDVLIPSAWVQAAVGAAEKLGITPSGLMRAGLDVADTGADLNCFAGRHGILLRDLQSWSGKDSDIYRTTVRAFALCDQGGYRDLYYDADGMGAGVRGDANMINAERKTAGRPLINEEPFRGSAPPDDPKGELVPGRKNLEHFANLKAMSWIALRRRFERVYRVIVQGMPLTNEDRDEVIAIAPALPELSALLTELSLPTYSLSGAGKILVDKGSKSPNRADAVMIAFNPTMSKLEAWLRL